MLVLVVYFCFVLLFCYLKKKQGKEKAKEQFKCSSRRWVRDHVKLNKKNGLDYLQKDDFNGKLRKIVNHLRFIYSTQ